MTAPFSNRSQHAGNAATHESAGASNFAEGGNIKVAVRFRPLSKDPERNRKRNADKTAWNTEKVGAMVSLSQKGYGPKVEGRSVFHFDQVFGEDSQTALVYKSIARPMVSASLNGKHATIFAYGQTGSGKTFTMQGEGKIGSGKAGIIQLVTSDIFRFMGKGSALQRDFKVKVSYFEIYNEKIRDLLSTETENASADNPARNEQVQIRTSATGEIVVNVEQKHVGNVDEALELLVHGNACRTVAATDMNSHSSRSHAVFRLTIESRSTEEQHKVGKQDQEILRVSDFNLVDLAGSESLKATNATGHRKREGGTINKSLLALTTVIQSLSQPAKKRPQHINYRDSKLTRILQPHLSGNAEMAILCCASPSIAFLEETRSTLKFAARAKLVQVKPQINEVMDDSALIKKLQLELSRVREELEAMKQKGGKTREDVFVESDLNQTGDTIASTESFDLDVSEKTSNELSASASGFQLDAADPDAARRAVKMYKRGDAYDPDDSVNSSQDGTMEVRGDRDNKPSRHPTPRSCDRSTDETESFDTPVSREACSEEDSKGKCSVFSTKNCSRVSCPETIRGGGNHPGGESIFRSLDGSISFAPNGRLGRSLSWDATDAVDLGSYRTGRPLSALESMRARKRPLPVEVTVMNTMLTSERNNMCLTDRLIDAEARVKFLEDKVKLSEDAIESGARDMQRARRRVRDLVDRNVAMKVRLKEKERDVTKQRYERGEVMVEQYWILKASMYVGIFFYLLGAQECFLGAVFFVWLAIEMSVTA
mmetsp:Transcript_29307/g.79322  ORF Transcript_29307/g.79322 Transcript_29307/m.79322 type:complete len:770 (+) Transcript_29307:261-2570(+)